jgi:hypothetical protein
MNEVSIIINGVRYDAVEAEPHDFICKECELPMGLLCDDCQNILAHKVFKKSTKSFER